MTHYQELTLLSHENIPLYDLWSKIYRQIHLALVGLQDALGAGRVGVAFPQYRFDVDAEYGCLGSKLRVFADDTAILQQLNLAQHLRRYADYVRLNDIQAVPAEVTQYACYHRVQVKSGAERAARRLIKRHPELDYATELARLQTLSQRSALPFVQLSSTSTGQTFQLLIAKSSADAPQSGDFGTYGLSKYATVPDF